MLHRGLSILVAASILAGCSTLNWREGAERWRDSLCRTEENVTCHDHLDMAARPLMQDTAPNSVTR